MDKQCFKNEQWGELNVKLQLYDNHLNESEKRGGYRDRVNKLEDELKNLKKDRLLLILVCLIGSFLGEVLPLKDLLFKLFT